MVMLAAWIVSLSLVGQTAPTDPLRMPSDDQMRQENVTAEYLSAPFGIDVEKFAHETVVLGGLVQWDGGPPTSMTVSSGYRLFAIGTGDGRSVIAIFRPETNPRDICVVRAAANGSGPAAYRANRWCAAKFGITLPEVRIPPIP